MIEIVAPDGSIVEFPDGTPDDVITGVMRQNYPAGAAPQAAPQQPAAPIPGPEVRRDLVFDDAGNASLAYGGAPPAPPSQDQSLIDAVLRAKVPGDERSVIDNTTGLLASIGRGAWQGVGNIVGLPADLINMAPMLGNLLPGEQGIGPLMDPSRVGSQRIRNTVGAAAEAVKGAPLYDPQGPVERFGQSVGQEVGAAAVPLAAGAAMAGRLGVEGARQLGPVGRYALEGLAVDPGKVIGNEIATAAAAGIGAQTGREIFGQDSAGGALAGGVAGAGLYGIGRAAAPSARDLVAGVTGNPNYASDVVKEAVADAIIGRSDILSPQMAKPGAVVNTDPLIEALTRKPDIQKQVPGYQPTTAEAAGDMGLADLEVSRARSSPTRRYAARAEANTAAVDDRLSELAPTEQPGAFSSALEQYRGQRLQGAADDLGRAQAAFEDAISRLQPTMNGETRGATIRAALVDAQAAAKEVERAAWRNVAGPVYVDPLAESFARINAGLNPSERRAVQSVAGAIGTPAELVDGGLADLTAITSLRSEFSTAKRAAMAARDGNAVRLINQHIDAIDEYLDAAIPPQLRGEYDRARAVTLDVNERFNRTGDPIAATLDTYEGGRPVKPDSGVAGQFVQPDEKQASNLGRLFDEAGTPEVRDVVRDQILAEASGKSAGYMKPGSIEDYIAGRSQVFGQMPETRADLQRGASTRRGVMRAEQQQADTMAEVGPGGRGPVAKYLQYSDARAADAMKNVMAAKNPGKQADDLLAAAGNDPKAVQGARRAWWDVMEQEGRSRNSAMTGPGGVPPWAPPRWKAWLQKPAVREVAERLYRDDPEHLQNLDGIAEALRAVSADRRAVIGKNPSGTEAMRRGATITTAEVQSKLYEVARGRVNKMFFVTYLTGKYARRAVQKQSAAAYDRLLDDALLEPDIAKLLMTEYNPADRRAIARQLKAYYGNQANRILDVMNEDDESDPVTDAVLGVP